MRVITGVIRGKRLKTVPGNDLVRPTTEKVKEAVFSSIQFDIEGRRILDLFAGCGQLGIEALSRGAKSCVFVDSSKISLGVVKENLKDTPFEECVKLINRDWSSYILNTTETFDIAFLDPPYNAGILEKALNAVADKMSDYGKVFCEHPNDISLPDSVCGMIKFKEYKFGRINVSAYKKEQTANE